MTMDKMPTGLDMIKGRFVTVLEWRNGKDRSWCGAYLKVTALDWPLVQIQQHYWKDNKLVPVPDSKFILDLREVTIQSLPDEMVAGGEEDA